MLVQPPWWLALALALSVSGLGWSLGWLDLSGALSAVAIGFIIIGLGGGKFAVPLLAFFISSSALSALNQKLSRARNRSASSELPGQQRATRTSAQVLANGAAAAALVIAFWYFSRHWPWYKSRYLLMLYLAAIASVNADTWSTEIGMLSRRSPRLLTSWQIVPAGSSGAVTLPGIIGGLAGAFVAPLSALALWRHNAAELLAVAWAGFLAALADSILGAGVQAQYRDARSGALVDMPESPKEPPSRGTKWITNDMVNLLSSGIGVLGGWLLLRYAVYGPS
ncbi:MAG TPA: DUF92 domain-containing protein [Chthonomonadales bacterium]|nr:DUF92 domain-containing protein [Chthonomonadales bacterium]